MASTDHPHVPFVEVLLRVSLWLVLLVAVTYTRTDPDLWGHVRFGLDILRDGSIPQTDPYSFSSDRPWINHEWAAEVVAAAMFRFGGNAGLILLKLAAVGSLVLLLDSMLRRQGVVAVVARDALAAMAILATMEQTHHVRPQLFSVVCFAALLWVLMATAAHSRRWLLAVPPLFAMWANLHGGWILGGGVLAVWTLGLFLGGARRQAAWHTAIGIISFAATLATPYGVALWCFLFDTVGVGRADITEWQPIYALGWDAWVRWSAISGLCVLGLTLSRPADRRIERVAVAIVLAAAALMVTRLLAFLAISVLFLFGAALADAYQRRMAGRPAATRARGRVVLAAVALSTIAVALGLAAMNLSRLVIDRRVTPEPAAVEFLKRQPGSRVLVWFDWGEYAIWHLPRWMQVSIDGRRETVYSAALHQRHLRFYFDAPGGLALARDLGADYIWIPRTLPAARRLGADSAWMRLYDGEPSVIYGRAGLPRHAAPVALASVLVRVFPGP